MPGFAPALDTEHRATVREAAGAEFVDMMTARCMRAVATLLGSAPPSANDATRREAHRLAGGTVTMGLTALAECLRALETACCQQASPEQVAQRWAACNASLAATRQALKADPDSSLPD